MKCSIHITNTIMTYLFDCQMLSKLRNSSKEDIRLLLEIYEQFFIGKIKFLAFFSPFKRSLDFQKHLKTKISKIDPKSLEF